MDFINIYKYGFPNIHMDFSQVLDGALCTHEHRLGTGCAHEGTDPGLQIAISHQSSTDRYISIPQKNKQRLS